jgi:hypothetical protein
MKKLLMMLPFLLMGCGETTKVVYQDKTHSLLVEEKCNRLYGRILDLKFDELRDPHPYSQKEVEDGILALDEEYRTRGTTQTFLNNCQREFSQSQIACMMAANSLDGMSLCKNILQGTQ